MNLNNQLTQALKDGDLENVKKFVQKGTDVNKESVLYWASYNGHLEVIKYLVENCAVDVCTKHFGCPHPFTNASSNGHFDIVKYFVKIGIHQYHFDDAFCEAVVWNHYDVADYLLKHGANVHDNYLLHLIIENEDLNGIKYLVENGVNVDLALRKIVLSEYIYPKTKIDAINIVKTHQLIQFTKKHVQKVKHGIVIDNLEEIFWSPPNGIRYKELNKKYRKIIID